MNKDILGKYRLVLGLEIHLHLKTDKKMFCRCSADVYGKKPNTHTCPTCLGLPGALPVPNRNAVRKTQILGLALNSNINKQSRFDRKHYFYPDLPKGYQISQYKNPLCSGGHFILENGKKVHIDRVHLEEDTAKSMHEKNKTLIDFNLSSIPLVEVVTKPSFSNIKEAVEFSKGVQNLVRELGLGDVDMEKGQMRLEPNISLRTVDMEDKKILPEYKVEIKNINSFRFMEKAVTAEVKRQRKLLEKGETPIQENRGYDEDKKTTVSQRSKEQAHDYRYFPEPDIPPLEFDDAYLKELSKQYQELLKQTPSHKKLQILDDFKLENQVKERILHQLSEEEIAKMKKLISEGRKEEEIANLFLNDKDARKKSVDQIIKTLKEEEEKVSDEDVLIKVVKEVIDKNQDAVQSYQGGKENALQFLIGMVMRETKGKADAETAKKLLLENIN